MGGAGQKKGRIRPIKKQKLAEVRSEINVTPLVDVCLVLLIIFMVVTPMLARGKEVPLPQVEMINDDNDEDVGQPIVAIDERGKLYFDKFEVSSVDVMMERVQEAWRADATGLAQGKVYVKASVKVPYKKVYPIIIALHEQLGLNNIDLGTNKKKDK